MEFAAEQLLSISLDACPLDSTCAILHGYVDSSPPQDSKDGVVVEFLGAIFSPSFCGSWSEEYSDSIGETGEAIFDGFSSLEIKLFACCLKNLLVAAAIAAAAAAAGLSPLIDGPMNIHYFVFYT